MQLTLRDLGPRLAHQIIPVKTKGDSDWAYSWVPMWDLS